MRVKSNAIVFAKDLATVGIGAGQMSRVDASFPAARKAGDRAKGSVMASDAFFPFPDAVEVERYIRYTWACTFAYTALSVVFLVPVIVLALLFLLVGF